MLHISVGRRLEVDDASPPHGLPVVSSLATPLPPSVGTQEVIGDLIERVAILWSGARLGEALLCFVLGSSHSKWDSWICRRHPTIEKNTESRHSSTQGRGNATNTRGLLLGLLRLTGARPSRAGRPTVGFELGEVDDAVPTCQAESICVFLHMFKRRIRGLNELRRIGEKGSQGYGRSFVRSYPACWC